MPDAKQLRRQALELIEKGRAAFEKRSQRGDEVTVKAVNLKTGEVEVFKGKGRPASVDEYHLIFGRARDLLLRHGYERKLDPKVQEVFFDLIPPSKSFLDHQRTQLKALQSRNGKQRFEAAKFLGKEGCAEGNLIREEWMKRPELVEAITTALSRETDVKTQEWLIIALRSLFTRYFEDQRIFPAVFPFFRAGDRGVQRHAILACQHMKNREKWPVIAELMQTTLPQPTLQVLCGHISSPVAPVGQRRKLLRPLLDCWTPKLNGEAKAQLVSAIMHCVDEQSADEFCALRPTTKAFRNEVDEWLRLYCSREDREWYEAYL